MDEDFDAHLDLLKHTCDVAHAFNTTLIRVFSFYPSKGARIEEERAGVMERMAAMLAVAEQAGAILLHENESGIYGATPTGVKDLFATLPSDRLQGCFDPSNYVTEGFAPYDDGWKQGLDRLTHYFHVKDKVPGENTSVPAGEGAGQFPEILAELKARNWSGVMTLEPHLNPANERYAGLSGAERFVLAVQGLRRVLDAAGLAWQ